MTNTTTCKRITTRQAVLHIANHHGFKTNGSLWGSSYGGSYGQLPYERTTGYMRAQDADDFYAVYSYQTPIAWYAHGTWTVPNVSYSRTTSRHQSIVREAVNR